MQCSGKPNAFFGILDRYNGGRACTKAPRAHYTGKADEIEPKTTSGLEPQVRGGNEPGDKGLSFNNKRLKAE